MMDVFVPQSYASRTFWPHHGENADLGREEISDSKEYMTEIQPFCVYHLDQPHVIRKRHGHLGASPKCRASATESMDLVRKVLQPAINQDIVDVFKKYVSVFKSAAENVSVNMKTETFAACVSPTELDIGTMTYKACADALEHCKSLFDDNKSFRKDHKTENEQHQASFKKHLGTLSVASSVPGHLATMKRVPSPDFPWNKRLAKASPRRSLSPTPRKRGRPAPAKRYGSPQRGSKEMLKRNNWDPDKLTTDTQFVMGTKANKALGLGATRGRIYMKHPDLFKYSSDPEDKKWMVKNNCMVATGGKNTFIMIAENILELLENEYKESPGLQPEEMQLFKLPEFILQKMRALMIKEKRLSQKLLGKTIPPAPRQEPAVKSEWETSKSPIQPSIKQETKGFVKTEAFHHSRRHAAERAAAAITASADEGNSVSVSQSTISAAHEASSSDESGKSGSSVEET